MGLLNDATAQKQAVTDSQITANTAQAALLSTQVQDVVASNATLSAQVGSLNSTVADMIKKMDAILEARSAKTPRTDGSSQP